MSDLFRDKRTDERERAPLADVDDADESRDRVHRRATGIVHEQVGNSAQEHGSDRETRDPVHRRARGVVQDRLGDAGDKGVGSPGGTLPNEAPSYAAGHEPRTAATQSTGAKAAGSPPPPVDPESKYTYRHSRDFEIHILGAPAKIQFRLEASATDKGNARAIVKEADISWAANQKLIEKSVQGTDLKISSVLMKANADLLAEGTLPGPLAHLSVKTEVKGLDAGLSLKEGAQLKLMTFAVYGQGDFSWLFPANVQAVADLKGSIRIECALAPDIAKKLIELARSADAIKRSAAVEAKIAKNEKWLAYYKRRGVKDEVKRLEGELSKLRKVQAGVSKARDAAIEKMVAIGAALEKTAMGKMLKKATATAIGVAFKRLLPIYNVVSTMQDIYEVGSWLAGLDWGAIGDRIINGGDGGTTLSDGSHDADDNIGGGGDGFGEGGAGDVTDVNPDAIERELQQEANPELHATAKAVMGLLEKEGGDGPSVQLLAEDKATLNVVIPEDLTSAEIEAMKRKITNARAGHQDLVESVIEAIQEVRPLGQRRLGPEVAADAGHESKKGGAGVTKPQRDEPAALEKTTKPKPKARENPPSSRVPSTWIVDPADTLRKVITIDEATRQPMVPPEVEFPGFTARVVVTGVAQRSWDSGGEGQEASFMVKVTITPVTNPPAGVMLVGGRRIEEQVAIPDIIVDGVGLRRAHRL